MSRIPLLHFILQILPCLLLDHHLVTSVCKYAIIVEILLQTDHMYCNTNSGITLTNTLNSVVAGGCILGGKQGESRFLGQRIVCHNSK